MDSPRPTIGHVLHRLYLAGAEVLAADLSRQLNPRYRFVFLCLDEIGPLGHKLMEEGFEVVELHRRPGIDWRVGGRIRKAVEQHSIDLLHAHQYTPFFYASLSSGIFHGMRPGTNSRPRVLFTEHGRHYPDRRKCKRMIANRFLLGEGDRVTAVGQFIKQALIANEGIDSHRIEVIYNGIAPYAAKNNPRNARHLINIDRNDRVIMQVARFHSVKDHVTAICAFAQVVKKVNRARLVLIGDGEQRSNIESLVHELGLESQVTFTGVRDDVVNLLPGADVFLLSSLSEGVSVTLLEAMAAGVAICATDVGGNGEVVDHGRTGLLSPRRDVDALAGNLQMLLARPCMRARMAEAGQQRLRDYFSQATMHQAYAKVYDAMLASTGLR